MKLSDNIILLMIFKKKKILFFKHSSKVITVFLMKVNNILLEVYLQVQAE